MLLADRFKSVVANELHAHRAELIKSYAERMNKQNVAVTVSDATVINEDYINGFDAVLCDVPCSGTGVLKDNPDIKLNRAENDIASLTELQYKILSTVSNYLTVGGCLTYSTCSVLPEENDGVIKRFIKNNPNFEIVSVSSPLNGLKTKYGTQFLPHLSSGAGFYFSVLKRKE